MPNIEDRFKFVGTLNYEFDGTLNTSTSVMLSGFPMQLAKVDVSGFDLWSTLGGTTNSNIGSLTDAQLAANLNTSLANAGKLYWRLYALNGTSRGDSASINSTVDLITGFDLPIDRMRSPFGNEIIGGGGAANGELAVGFANHSAIGGFVRMYNGVTTDEANFVGYGMESDNADLTVLTPGINISDSGTGSFCYVYVCSYANITTFGAGQDADTDYSEFQGIPIVADVYASGTGALVSAAALSSSTDLISVSLDSMEFYTP